LPRWQEIPDAAKVGKTDLWRLRSWNIKDSIVAADELPIVVWSYCWFSKYHPDPKGEQLQHVLPILKVMVAEAKRFGEHCTVAVLVDYGSYPQYPRSSEEKQRFLRGLKGELNHLYSHPYTIVLMLDLPASDKPEHTSRRTYKQRGWCFTEKHLATIAKDAFAFWTLSNFQGASNYRDLRQQMKANRPVPIAPPEFGKRMRADVTSGALSFTAKADMDFVIDLYKRGFVNVIQKVDSQLWQETTQIRYFELGWSDSDLKTLEKTINYMKMGCGLGGNRPSTAGIELWLSLNNFSEAGKARLQALANEDVEINL